MLLVHLLLRHRKLIFKPFLKKGEVDERKILVKEFKFKFISVDKNSIKAVKEGNYLKVYRAREKLEKEGFSWSEKP